MRITIDLPPDEAARLTASARRRGLSLEDFVRDRLLSPPPRRRITALRGLGKEIWQGVDVRQYLGELRGDGS